MISKNQLISRIEDVIEWAIRASQDMAGPEEQEQFELAKEFLSESLDEVFGSQAPVFFERDKD